MYFCSIFNNDRAIWDHCDLAFERGNFTHQTFFCRKGILFPSILDLWLLLLCPFKKMEVNDMNAFTRNEFQSRVKLNANCNAFIRTAGTHKIFSRQNSRGKRNQMIYGLHGSQGFEWKQAATICLAVHFSSTQLDRWPFLFLLTTPC